MLQGCRLLAVCTVTALPLWSQTPDSSGTLIHAAPLPSVVITATGSWDAVQVGSTATMINVDSVLRVTPAATVTDILESRVPGLVVMHTSGVPGAPSTLYLRGESGISSSSQPIVIVDGIRLSANRSAPPSANLAGIAGGSFEGAPSALDQLDPHGIATIEILHGPSATALYGSDAAAGVIIIITKRGGEWAGNGAETKGAALHVTASLSGGLSSLLNQYPTNVFRFGYDPSGPAGSSGLCPATDATCTVDSLVRFQALNNSRYTPFGTAGHAVGSLTLSGGLSALAYSVTGSATSETGILQLPDLEATHFQQAQGFAAPDWLRTPDHYATRSGMGTLSAPLSRHGSVTLTGMLFNSTQQGSSLESAIPQLLGAYVDATTAGTQGFLTNDAERNSAHALSSILGGTAQWPLAWWLPLSATIGTDHITRNDKMILPAGYTSDADSLGFLQTGDATATTTTGTLSTLLPKMAFGFMHVTTALGVSAMRTSNVTSLAVYGPPVDQPATLQATSTSRFDFPAASTVGGFIQPRLDLTPRLFVNAGVRWDQNHMAGLSSSVSAFPQVDASWLASDEPFLHVKSIFSLLRFRLAYGSAGAQAGAAPVVQLSNPGSSTLSPVLSSLPMTAWVFTHPERSHELEGGADADVWDGRLSFTVTAYRKTSNDAMFLPNTITPLSSSPLFDTPQNTAVVRNTGLEAGVTTHLLQRALINWTLGATVGHNDNVVQSITPGGIQGTDLDVLGTRIATGAPLFGRWARPIVSFVDANHDGVIEANEVQVGSTAVSLGSEIPRTTLGINSAILLFGGRISAATTVEYDDGFSQANGAALAISNSGTTFLDNTANDPHASLAQRAAIAALPQTLIGAMQTVHALRWSELSVTYNVPQDVAHHVHLSALSVSCLGRNLALQTNYHGVDPAVNAITTGAGVMDLGEVPQPRTWDLRVNLGM